MKEMTLEPDRKYRGSAWVNAYGEIQFRPYQPAAAPKGLRLVAEHESFSIYENKDIFKVSVKFSKEDFDMLAASNKMMFILTQLEQYLT